MSSLFGRAWIVSDIKTISNDIVYHISLVNFLFIHFLIYRLCAKKFTLILRMSIHSVNCLVLNIIPHFVTPLTLDMRTTLYGVPKPSMIIKRLPDHLDRIFISLFLSA